MLTFMVPPGIGDFSAMYSKLCNINREISIISSCDNPNRLSDFLDILPRVNNGGYGNFNAAISLVQSLPPGTDLRVLEDGDYFLAINPWLEAGQTVDTWVPGETDYHYEMLVLPDKMFKAMDIIDEAQALRQGPVIGIYTSAHGNARHWNFWLVKEWWSFLEALYNKYQCVFVFIGAEYDIDLGTVLFGMCMAEGIPAINTIGELHISSTIELIQRLDYFFSFPSGLGFLADVVGTPHTMWFPHHLSSMMNTFCDPKNSVSGRTEHRLFEAPGDAIFAFKKKGLIYMEERASCRR